MSLSFTFTFALLTSVLIDPVSGNQQCQASPLLINPTAQVRFSVVSSIRQSTRTEECYRVSQNAVQYLAAIQWAVDVINSLEFLKVMSLGRYMYPIENL